jgi:hypothetical protein
LGFGAGEVYLAGLTHALRVQFVGGGLSKPVTSAVTGAARGMAQELTKATYSNVWPEVDMIYTTAPRNVAESTYVVNPGARVADIRLRYNAPVERAPDGGLRFTFSNGYMTEAAPIAWQEVGGRRVAVQVSFVVLGPQEVGFTVGTYARTLPLIIDPAYYWHSFYGSSSNDYGYGIAVDSDNNIYTVGASSANWKGPSDEDPLHAYSGNSDIAIVKLNSAGAYQWHTFYGSNDVDVGNAITLDSAANLYVLGRSQMGWNGNGGLGPLTPHTGAGADNLVILKLSRDGGYYWHTFFYGSTKDSALNTSAGIAVDSNFNVYVVGTSDKTWIGPYDVRPDALHDINGAEPLNPYSGGDDIVVVKLNNDGTYAWHTYYGSATDDSGRGITVDATGRLVVVGDSDAAWTGTGGKAPLKPYIGGRDIVILKLNGAGAYYWHTFLGSAADDFAYSVTSDDDSNIYLAGNSLATWNGPGGGAPRHAFQGGSDIVVVKLTATGTYKWHGFYGAASNDYGKGIAVDDTGVTIGGTSSASWGVAGKPLRLDPYSGGTDMVALKLNKDGRYLWHAFYGGSGSDDGSAIAVDSSGKTFMAGTSGANWVGVGNTQPLHATSGGQEMVIVATRAIFYVPFRSVGTYDGWVLEQTETSGTGGTKNPTATTIRVGDDASNRQYRSVLHFNTSDLPDNATIVGAVVSTKVQGVTGVDPTTTHGNLNVDIRSSYFGSTPGLELADFNATASKSTAGTMTTYTVSGWKSANLQATAFQYILVNGTTQFRLQFALDDNNNSVADYLSFYSGNDVSSNAPLLQILYYLH